MTGRVLVTGAAGFIGSHVCEALIARGDTVVGLDNFDPYYARAVKEANLGALRGNPRFTLREADVARDAVDFAGYDAIIHLAGKPGVRPSFADPMAYVEANVGGTTRVLEGARRAGVTRIVYASSSSVYGDDTPAPFGEDALAAAPVSPYAATKRAGELVASAFASAYGTRVAALRFFTAYGPRQRPDLAVHRFTAAVARGEPIVMYGDGSSERDYTYITDAVTGVVAALDWTGRVAPGTMTVFNIGGGARVRLDRLIRLIGEALGRTPRVERQPDQMGDVRLTSADLTRSERELGYRPRVEIETGIREFVRWWEEMHGRQS